MATIGYYLQRHPLTKEVFDFVPIDDSLYELVTLGDKRELRPLPPQPAFKMRHKLVGTNYTDFTQDDIILIGE